MTAHPREPIMQRLFDVLQSIGVSTRRNTISINDAELPLIALLEGDEVTDEDDPVNRPTNAPRRVTMTPHVVIATGRGAGSPPADIGPGMNALYSEVLRVVLNDAELAALTLDGRGARFIGIETDLALGRVMLGQMAVKFALTYALRPAAL